MATVLGWLPVVWALRVALLVLLAGCSYVYLLLIAPFFRPTNIRRMITADLPRVRGIGAEIAGTRGEVHFVQDRRGQDTNEDRASGNADDVFPREGDDDPHRGAADQR